MNRHSCLSVITFLGVILSVGWSHTNSFYLFYFFFLKKSCQSTFWLVTCQCELITVYFEIITQISIVTSHCSHCFKSGISLRQCTHSHGRLNNAIVYITVGNFSAFCIHFFKLLLIKMLQRHYFQITLPCFSSLAVAVLYFPPHICDMLLMMWIYSCSI